LRPATPTTRRGFIIASAPLADGLQKSPHQKAINRIVSTLMTGRV
jgi:hypothetical protein